MEYRYIAPPCPSLARWRYLTSNFSGQSVLRQLQYEHLEKIQLSGDVLDVGGGQRAKYLDLLRTPSTLRSVNIDPAIEPTHLVKPGQPLPFGDSSFDAIVSLNTLEHIYDASAVLREIFRVLRPGGSVHITVPFMFRIHGHPDDYFRATPSWWRETFDRTGFSSMELHPLVWGRASTKTVVPGVRGMAPRLRRSMAMLVDVLSASILFHESPMEGRRGERLVGTSPGWFMTAEK